MGLNALKPDEVVMLSVNEHRGTGGKEAHAGGLQGYRGTACSASQVTPLLQQVLSQGGQLKEVCMKYSQSLCWCSQLHLQSYCLDTLCKSGGKQRLVAFPVPRWCRECCLRTCTFCLCLLQVVCARGSL